MRTTAVLLGLLLLSGCENGSAGVAGTPTPPKTPTPTPTPTATPVSPVFREARGFLHVHSPFSHDACDGHGLDANGIPDAECLAQLRAAACASGADFVALTDHPNYMSSHPFLDDMLYDATAGDELVMEGGEAAGNRVACDDGHRVLVTVGYEATHTLPLGLRHHLAPELYASATDAVPLADTQALVAGLKYAGAVTALAHSEEDDLSAARIVEAGFDAMEWYNPHGNFKTVLGGDSLGGDPLAVIDTLKGAEPFLLGSDSGAHADLVYLLLLPSWPQAGFDKWREVNRSRAVTGLFGSDVHRNISVDPVCAGDPTIEALCAVAAALYPNALTLLLSGGEIVLTDGQRLDSYERVFRWLENRVLLPEGTEATPASIADAIRSGRVYGLFGVFGEPSGFAFTGTGPDGVRLPVGSTVAMPAALRVELPFPEERGGGAPPFDSAAAATAEITLRLFRTDAAGTTLVAESANAALDFTADAAGAYHVEVWIRPHHLAGALGDVSSLADIEYQWLITNPIRAGDR